MKPVTAEMWHPRGFWVLWISYRESGRFCLLEACLNDEKPSVLLTGVTGFIGGRLLYALDQEGVRVRSLVRSKTKIKINGMLNNVMEVVTGDLLDSASLPPAMEGIETAYYLVHSMGGRNERQARNFAESDNAAARNFLSAAEAAGVNRIIYLGGLGESEEGLSKHLASRREVGDILKSGSIDVTVLQAAVIIGAGGASFEMIRHLVERLPVIMCPKEINTRCQPIAVANVIEYLVGCRRRGCACNPAPVPAAGWSHRHRGPAPSIRGRSGIPRRAHRARRRRKSGR